MSVGRLRCQHFPFYRMLLCHSCALAACFLVVGHAFTLWSPLPSRPDSQTSSSICMRARAPLMEAAASPDLGNFLFIAHIVSTCNLRLFGLSVFAASLGKCRELCSNVECEALRSSQRTKRAFDVLIGCITDFLDGATQKKRVFVCTNRYAYSRHMFSSFLSAFNCAC
jgi:hypothetical protein